MSFLLEIETSEMNTSFGRCLHVTET